MPQSLVERIRIPERRLSELAREVEYALECGSVHHALRLLNERTRHRFTGLYRLDAPVLRNVALFDRENPTLELGGDMPLHETYCAITAATRAPLGIADAGVDPRLVAHPARDSVLSYCGVPVCEASGEPVGTLCHFDLRPRLVPVGEIPLMLRVAPTFAWAMAHPVAGG